MYYSPLLEIPADPTSLVVVCWPMWRFTDSREAPDYGVKLGIIGALIPRSCDERVGACSTYIHTQARSIRLLRVWSLKLLEDCRGPASQEEEIHAD